MPCERCLKNQETIQHLIAGLQQARMAILQEAQIFYRTEEELKKTREEFARYRAKMFRKIQQERKKYQNLFLNTNKLQTQTPRVSFKQEMKTPTLTRTQTCYIHMNKHPDHPIDESIITSRKIPYPKSSRPKRDTKES